MTEDEAAGADMLPGLRASVADARQRAARTRRRNAARWEPAALDPVARVLVDLPLAHLDRPFDYAVPESMAAAAVPGARVKVRFAGQDVDGFVVARGATTDHTGTLQPLRRVVSPEPVLSPVVAELTARLAGRYAGTRSDVLRLAVPPRHAATEKEPSPGPGAPARPADHGCWEGVPGAAAYLEHLARGDSPRAVWGAAPGDDWPGMVSAAVAATVASGRGAVVCVPDQRDVDRISEALSAALGPGHHAVLTADHGPAARYRDFLSVSRGARRVVVGTRSAAFAPVRDLGLVVVWDDGDDLHQEPRAPYPHVREVLLTRSTIEDAAVLVGGFARTTQAQLLLDSGWARELVPTRASLRERARVEVLEGHDRARGTRLPGRAVQAIREGLRSGPVLVQTPRAGYVPALACERCRMPARCSRCSGPLALSSAVTPPTCRWCGTAEGAWSCGECGHRGLRAPVLGEARTAEELGRTFTGATVRSSSGERMLATVPDAPALVVATVGAEPVAPAGYAAVVLLDTWVTLARDDLRVAEEAFRRWAGAAGMVRPGGRVVAVGDPGHHALQALVRWDPAGLAAREIAERSEARLPPAARLATITGAPGAVDDALTLLALPDHAEVLGPVAHGEEVRAVVRAPRRLGPVLTEALVELQRLRSARKLEPVRVQVDPPTL